MKFPIYVYADLKPGDVVLWLCRSEACGGLNPFASSTPMCPTCGRSSDSQPIATAGAEGLELIRADSPLGRQMCEQMHLED